MTIGELIPNLIRKCQTEDISINCDESGCAIYVGSRGIWVDRDWLYRGDDVIKEDIDNLVWATQRKARLEDDLK